MPGPTDSGAVQGRGLPSRSSSGHFPHRPSLAQQPAPLFWHGPWEGEQPNRAGQGSVLRTEEGRGRQPE